MPISKVLERRVYAVRKRVAVNLPGSLFQLMFLCAKSE